jgi:hypothetical protein
MQQHAAADHIRISSERVSALKNTNQGFDISVTYLARPETWILSLGGWHDDFNEPGPVADLVAKALTGSLRLRVSYSNGTPFEWRIEQRIDDETWADLFLNGITPKGRGEKTHSMFINTSSIAVSVT